MSDISLSEPKRKNINRGFRKLDIWKLSILYYRDIVRILSMKSEIPFKVRSQLYDSALSISSNVAEGYARRSIKENLRFYEIALSSSAENCSQLHALTNASQISIEDFELLDLKLYEIENKLIKMNQSLIDKLNKSKSWKDDYK